jgi:hypothetical protein
MIARIRELMAVPFARPPGRRSLWARFAPEWCALLVYGVLYATSRRHCLPGYPWASMWMPGMVYAYLCAGVLLLTVPVLMMAGAFAGEREGGEADILALTTADRSALAWGRFLHLAFPWLRFILWLLPLYVLHRVLLGYGSSGPSLNECMFYTGGPKVVVAWLLLIVDEDIMDKWAALKYEWYWQGLLTIIPRMLNDAIQLLACLSLAYYISVRVKRTRTALIAAGILVPVAAATALAPAEWAGYLLSLSSELLGIRGVLESLAGPLLLVLAAFAFKIWLAFWLVRKVARNFDAYLLGEKPGAAP